MIKAKAVHDGVALSQDWRPQQLLTQAEVKKSEEEEGWQAAWRACASWPDEEEEECDKSKSWLQDREGGAR